jgi:hypothetical protein
MSNPLEIFIAIFSVMACKGDVGWGCKEGSLLIAFAVDGKQPMASRVRRARRAIRKAEFRER